MVTGLERLAVGAALAAAGLSSSGVMMYGLARLLGRRFGATGQLALGGGVVVALVAAGLLVWCWRGSRTKAGLRPALAAAAMVAGGGLLFALAASLRSGALAAPTLGLWLLAPLPAVWALIAQSRSQPVAPSDEVDEPAGAAKKARRAAPARAATRKEPAKVATTTKRRAGAAR